MWTVIIVLALLIPLIAVILDSAPARAFASRLERDAPAPGGHLDGRVAALEAEVERLTQEIERLGEESAFLQRLLETKDAPPPSRLEPPGRPIPPGERRE